MGKIRKIIFLIMILTSCLYITGCSLSNDKAISAYEIAVENGFVGTESEWLESLKPDVSINTEGYFVIDGEETSVLAITSLDISSDGYWIVNNVKTNIKAVGSDGVTTIKESLYDLAKENGFSGTAQEWLESLKTDTSVQKATSKAIRSVVSIYCSFIKTTYSFGFGSKGEVKNEYSSAGSGVIFKEDERYVYILTNYHVVYDSYSDDGLSSDIEIYLYGKEYEGMQIKASYVGGSLTEDIAVLKIANDDVYKESGAAVCDFANSLDVVKGETAIAIGNPKGDGTSVTNGIISVESEYLSIIGADNKTELTLRVFRIDTPVNSGNSGGGLFNDEGCLIGIVNAKTSSTSVENIGYAIPSNIALNVAFSILENEGVARKNNLGISLDVDSSYVFYDEVNGLSTIIQDIKLTSIDNSSCANGYLEEGDILKSFTYDFSGNKKTIEITRVYTITDYIYLFKSNTNITFEVIRDGKTIEVEFSLNSSNAIT